MKTLVSAINVPYKHSVGQYQIYILGGYNNIEGQGVQLLEQVQIYLDQNDLIFFVSRKHSSK